MASMRLILPAIFAALASWTHIVHGAAPEAARTWADQQAEQTYATRRLALSPRHGEWVETHAGGQTLKAWVDSPPSKGKMPVVIVLHEVFGLTDSTRNTADEIAAMGYIVITPDMLSGLGPAGGDVSSFPTSMAATDAMTHLSDEVVNGRLNAWMDYAAALPNSSGQIAIVGLSWGGGAAFRFATSPRRDLAAVFVFYDVGPPAITQKGLPGSGTSGFPVEQLKVPVHGFYPSRDARVMKTLQATTDAMTRAGKVFDPVTYEGADHAFMRVGENPTDDNPANAAAVAASLARLREQLATAFGAADSSTEAKKTPAAPKPSFEEQMAQIAAAEVRLGSDEWHAQRLALSPRRHEQATLKQSTRTLRAFVAFPHTPSGKAPVVLMVPEDQGLNRWARDMADQIAAMGYIVVVPDLLSGHGPHGGGREDFHDIASALGMHVRLLANEGALTADLNTWADYGLHLPQSDGKLAVLGFAWGGGRAFWFATQRKDLAAAYIFYDWSPPPNVIAGLTAPVYGFYAQNDNRVTKSLAATIEAMTAAGKVFEPEIYAGSDHMFMRLGDEPGDTNPANIAARAQALARLQRLLGNL